MESTSPTTTYSSVSRTSLPTAGEVAQELYEDYLGYLYLWSGLSKDVLRVLGEVGCHLFDAEFLLRGPQAYSTSVVQPIRNAYYCKEVMERRWERLQGHKLVEPILDYGCGIGFTLAFLHRYLDLEELYAYEPEGMQLDFLHKYGKYLGLQVCTNPAMSIGGGWLKFGTVLCTNVLEHLDHPLTTLHSLYELSSNVLGNCDLTEQVPHIAPMDERRACVELLRERGGLWEIIPGVA